MNTHTAENTEQLHLGTEVLARARELLAEFQKREPTYAALKLLESYPDDCYRLATIACKLFQVEVVLFHPVTGLHGVTEGSCILLAGYGQDSRYRRPFCIAGHEVSHVLGIRRPQKHAELTSYIMREYVLDHAFHSRSQIEKLNRGILRPFAEDPVPDNWTDIVNEEVIADIAGELWQNPVFWAAIHKRDLNAERRTVYAEIMARLEVERPMPYRPWASDVGRVIEKYVEYALGFLRETQG
jgi:hypothetical protein